jgi:hypothetical protein
MFIPTITTAHHLSLSIRSTPSLSSYPLQYISTHPPTYTCAFKATSLPKPCTQFLSSPSLTNLIILDFDHPQKILWAVQIMKLFYMQFSAVSCHCHLSGPNIFLGTLYIHHANQHNVLVGISEGNKPI